LFSYIKIYHFHNEIINTVSQKTTPPSFYGEMGYSTITFTANFRDSVTVRLENRSTFDKNLVAYCFDSRCMTV